MPSGLTDDDRRRIRREWAESPRGREFHASVIKYQRKLTRLDLLLPPVVPVPRNPKEQLVSTDPIRARLDEYDHGDLRDALRAVLDLCAEALPMSCGSPTQALTPDRVLRVIAEHLLMTWPR